MAVKPIPKPKKGERAKRPPLNWRGFKFPRPKTVRDQKYARRAIKVFDCAIRGRKGHVCGPKLAPGRVLLDASHIPTGGQRGMSLKGGERGGVIVLCRFAHMRQHAIGWPRFIDEYRINPKQIATYMAERLNDED